MWNHAVASGVHPRWEDTQGWKLVFDRGVGREHKNQKCKAEENVI